MNKNINNQCMNIILYLFNLQKKLKIKRKENYENMIFSNGRYLLKINFQVFENVF